MINDLKKQLNNFNISFEKVESTRTVVSRSNSVVSIRTKVGEPKKFKTLYSGEVETKDSGYAYFPLTVMKTPLPEDKLDAFRGGRLLLYQSIMDNAFTGCLFKPTDYLGNYNII